MEVIKKGYTNISYKDGNLFKQEKILNGFNHNVSYQVLNQLDFVPKFIENNDKFVVWEYVKHSKFQITKASLSKIAQNLLKLHQSNLIFQENFMLKRLEFFVQEIKKLNRWTDVLEKSWGQVKKIFQTDNNEQVPIHNDLYFSNILMEGEKLWFVDWEYASLGNKFYDLALFVCATDLDKFSEKTFLSEYGVRDFYSYYQQKLVAYFFILTWALAKKEIPINDKFFGKKLELWSQFILKLDQLRDKNYSKIIFVDLDGTTLDYYNGYRSAASEQIKLFFNDLEQKNILIVPATGRGDSHITREIMSELDRENYILSNGAEIYIGNEQIFSSVINKEILISLLKIVKNSNCLSLLKIDNDEVLYFENEEISQDLKFFENTSRMNLEDIQKQNVYQVLIWNKDIQVINKLLKKLKNDFSDVLNIHSSGSKDDFIEITNLDTSKGAAEIIFANLLNVNLKNTYHIGDSLNDASPKNKVNKLIAMANSSPKLLEIADIKAEFDNKNSGIIDVIKKYCL
ncbi:hypothetical protein C4M97_01905 [Mycoplasmopsis pullorum]|uniref:HAD hydrolase family protein n=1 Tax=Mycoplasmopsis pullorum TaxID=48003 RepID=UPI0011191B93|nr:HAD hydrolase family protein [Mycoplasmopsis pullorum]TNK82608.1 hypothetical protein C4M94_00290 [Mycoplasmopsis pullorum]TNK83507.1 hypothetical protein C4M80_00115 [Mycoplasmopsis pullorum]TNK84935.1 hypothetical protein C4M81_00825 [Mycoplasmopsis pullorum]TNK85727.1 hypothetical protein C4M92_00350 [Mycoplasmopsis pullorum]TNK86268.1 hypothetical protein C4M85_00520 [Mycoplasmopsis pullorum]